LPSAGTFICSLSELLISIIRTLSTKCKKSIGSTFIYTFLNVFLLIVWTSYLPIGKTLTHCLNSNLPSAATLICPLSLALSKLLSTHCLNSYLTSAGTFIYIVCSLIYQLAKLLPTEQTPIFSLPKLLANHCQYSFLPRAGIFIYHLAENLPIVRTLNYTMPELWICLIRILSTRYRKSIGITFIYTFLNVYLNIDWILIYPLPLPLFSYWQTSYLPNSGTFIYQMPNLLVAIASTFIYTCHNVYLHIGRTLI